MDPERIFMPIYCIKTPNGAIWTHFEPFSMFLLVFCGLIGRICLPRAPFGPLGPFMERNCSQNSRHGPLWAPYGAELLQEGATLAP